MARKQYRILKGNPLLLFSVQFSKINPRNKLLRSSRLFHDRQCNLRE